MILTNTEMIRFTLATLFVTLINMSNLIHLAIIVSCDTLSNIQLLLSWCTNIRIAHSISSSRIVSVYIRIVSRASCSSQRFGDMPKSPPRQVPKRNSYKRAWVSKGPRYVLNSIDLSLPTLCMPETPLASKIMDGITCNTKRADLGWRWAR